MSIRIVGDVHQDYDQLVKLINPNNTTICVGDLGFNYQFLRDNKQIFGNFLSLGGNHDNYDLHSIDYYAKQPFMLNDYGMWQSPGLNFSIFYIRGAWSIDQEYRTPGVDWWEKEQLSIEELDEVISLYKEVKPVFVITHECPVDIVHYLIDGSKSFCGYNGVIKNRTNQALQTMFNYHRPKQWFLGHYHRRWSKNICGTQFTCLDMLRSDKKNHHAYIDIDENGEVVQ